jgi:hypothetical protein
LRPVYTTVLAALLAVPALTAALHAETHPDFSGVWKQANERCIPKQSGEATITIKQHDPQISIEMASKMGTAPVSRGEKLYTLNGKPTMMKDSEGDEVDNSVTWHDKSIVFSTDEHEDGRILHSEETWTLVENGSVLQRIRTGLKSGRTQTLIYVKESR